MAGSPAPRWPMGLEGMVLLKGDCARAVVPGVATAATSSAATAAAGTVRRVREAGRLMVGGRTGGEENGLRCGRNIAGMMPRPDEAFNSIPSGVRDGGRLMVDEPSHF